MDSLETKVCHEWSEPIMTLDQQWYPPLPPPLTAGVFSIGMSTGVISLVTTLDRETTPR